MEVYILDSLLRRNQVVDKFKSLIWTERWAEIGDFELKLRSTLESRNQFTVGTRVAVNGSYRVMTIESVEDSADDDGHFLLVKGRSLEAILEDRIAKDTLSELLIDPKWLLSGTPGDIVRTMFNDICVLGNLDPGDVIPFLTPGTIYPTETISEYTTSIDWEQDPATLYDAIKELCDLYDLGFRLVRNFDTSELYFNVYTGNDRTTGQTLLPLVIFALGFDNLQNINELTTISKSKNVAYVFCDVGSAVVYSDDVDPEVEGFERKVLLVDASSVTDETPDIPAALTQKGKEELAKNRGSSILDGELNQNSAYRYGLDYELGDLVELRNVDGVVSKQRVTEQIFVCDSEGERSYPTLFMKYFIAPNTWLAWFTQQVWEDFDTEHWDEM